MSYENELYSYEYPISWDRRNKNYLKKVHNRSVVVEMIVPIVFRLRFYIDDKLISDETYSPTNNTIRFPMPYIVQDKVFSGWQFEYNSEYKIITSENYDDLKVAILDGCEDIKLTALYEDIVND